MLGQQINELRIAMGWSQVQLAEKLNISKQTVSNWETFNLLSRCLFGWRKYFASPQIISWDWIKHKH